MDSDSDEHVEEPMDRSHELDDDPIVEEQHLADAADAAVDENTTESAVGEEEDPDTRTNDSTAHAPARAVKVKISTSAKPLARNIAKPIVKPIQTTSTVHAGVKRSRTVANFFGAVSERAAKRLQLDRDGTSIIRADDQKVNHNYPQTSFECSLKQRGSSLLAARVVFSKEEIESYLGSHRQWTKHVQLIHQQRTWNVRVTLARCSCVVHLHWPLFKRMNCSRNHPTKHLHWFHAYLEQTDPKTNDGILAAINGHDLDEIAFRNEFNTFSNECDMMEPVPSSFFASAICTIFLGIRNSLTSSDSSANSMANISNQVISADAQLQRLWSAVKTANVGDVTFRVANNESVSVPSVWFTTTCPLYRWMTQRCIHTNNGAIDSPATSNMMTSGSKSSSPTSASSSTKMSSSSSTPSIVTTTNPKTAPNGMLMDGVLNEPHAGRKHVHAMLDTLILQQLPDTSTWTLNDWQPFYDLCHKWFVDPDAETTSANSSNGEAANLPIMQHVTHAFHDTLRIHIRCHAEAVVARRIARNYPALQPLVHELRDLERNAYARKD